MLLFFPLRLSYFFAILFFFFYSKVRAQCPVPTHPTAIAMQPTCTERNGIITVNNPAPGPGVIYSINGTGNSNTSGIFPNLTRGTYIVTVNYGQGCISLPLNVIINEPPPIPEQPITTLTQPGCNLATGTITVNSPAPATGISYSIDGADYSNTTGVFSDLAPKTYGVTVKNSYGCVSPALPVTINAQPPTPAQPITTQNQPGCTITTGTITVNTPAPTTGISYSIDGTDYSNTSGIFPGLNPNTYRVTVKNNFGCISTALNVTINTQPSIPAQATATSTQPNCTLTTGTITINAPSPATGISYSIDGIDYRNTSGIFPGLSSKTYNITVKNSLGCISPALSVTINSSPPTPAQPIVVLTQPSCTLAAGIIAVDTPKPSSGISYSIDGIDYTNTTGIFSALAPNKYNLTVKNSDGCISPALNLTINTPPPTPPQPIATLTQPTCIVATGTITVSSPAPGTGISYSINGTDYTNTTGIFRGLEPKTYTITVKHSNGCISPTLSVIVNSPLSTLAATATAADIPCGQSTGRITVNVTGGASPFTYSLNGATPVAGNIFSGLAAGSYKVTVK